MFSSIKASQSIKDEFTSYISTTFHIADADYAKKLKESLDAQCSVAKGPYLDIGDSFKVGKSLENLIVEGEVSPLFRELERDLEDGEKEIKLLRKLYLHQENAIRKINHSKNLVITTGTGSGKTECFIIPILNHLLREKQNGSLDDGVRAILIYPMNALANDQMKRLRSVLRQYPDITFGVYNSSTKYENADGIAEYGKVYKDENGRPLKPLKNEVISRKAMQKTPPHILVTNYAMLEYMMLRPNDDLVFSGAKLCFLVLDEAHIYRGATGIETSLLLRRLKARISDPTKVLHILTSATLGGKESDKDIVSFASTLCEAAFREEDIIRSETEMPAFHEEEIDYPMDLFAELANPNNSLNGILDKYSVEYNKSQLDGEILYNLCLKSKAYRVLRKFVTKPMTVKEITSLMRSCMDISEGNVIDLINIAAKAENNKTALIKARYHMFIRALEGAYITLDADKKLFLTRKKHYEKDNDSWRVFEAAVCDDCGRMGIAGRIGYERLEFAGNRFADDIEIFLIKEQNETLFDDDDENDVDEIEDIGKNDFLICAKCGEIHHESLKFDFKCNDGASNLVKIRRAERRGVRNDARCPCCNLGHMKLFYLGYEAATAVLGTELFEQLPESEKRLKSGNQEVRPTGNLFAAARPITVETVRKKRQFLVFSDSRSEAAYYACYMASFYEEFLRRRGIWHVIEENKQNIKRNPWDIKTLVDELTSYFDSNRTFASPTDNGTENLTPISRSHAYVAVLNEMVNARRSTSLVSLGVLNFVYKGNTDELMQKVSEAYGQTPENTKALFNILAMDIVYNGAIEGDCSLSDDMKEYIYYSPKVRRFTRCKESDNDRAKNYLNGWIPRVRKNGKLFSNGRITRVMNSLGLSEGDAKQLLCDYWDGVLTGGEYCLTHTGENEYYFSTDKFIVQVGEDNLPIYICDKCGKATMTNFNDKCISLKCDGRLREISRERIIEGNHFVKLYSSKLMKPLHIKEHTAQLGREEQQKYQELFVNKNINALSCSTTFEMGVDVGDLETVFLRNMPPSPANYVQRAGRAGRSLHAAAYSLTYSKLSSHDFTYFEHPEKMICGRIGAPQFTVKNEKVVLRHIFAVALSKFFSAHEEVYNSNNANVFLNQDGYEKLCEYLNARSADLKDILMKSIPLELHSDMGICDDSWIDKMIGENGQLNIAVLDFRNTVKWYETEIKRFKRQGDNQAAAAYERRLWEYRKAADDKRGKNDLIEFLVRNNILPKYGFPVDTVELYQNMEEQTKKLQMVRDLQLAIAEYAPDSQVVADGKLYTSRYIRKLPQATGQDWEEVYITECKNPSCKTWNHRITEPSKNGEKCVSCQEIVEKARWKKAIEPRKGFIAEPKAKDVPLRKPERSYRSEDYYIGDPQRKMMDKKTFVINSDYKIQMETSSNDSLMVVCKDDFHVCPRCGYAIGSISAKDEKDINSYANSVVKKHKSPWGKECDSKLYKRSLCHAFKTDVVKLVFGTSRAKNSSTMLSVMYALLESVSNVLDIERTDIRGCLHRVRYEGSLVYSIILYDAVAGGAGHVRRLVTDECEVFQKVIKEAEDITKNCNCDPSCYNCLRNYYNQSIHDQLNRIEANGFLKQYYGTVDVLWDDDFEEKHSKPTGEYDENAIKITNGYNLASFNDWSELLWLVPEENKKLFSEFEHYKISLPTEYGVKIAVTGTDVASEAMFIWKGKKILVFDNDKEKICIAGWKSFHCREIIPSEFSNLV